MSKSIEKPETITQLITKLEQIRAENGDLKVEEVESISKLVEDYFDIAEQSNAHIQVGSVVQISPEKESGVEACFLQVTELYSWGVQGFVAIPSAEGVKGAYYRAKWDEIRLIGQATWMPEDFEEEE